MPSQTDVGVTSHSVLSRYRGFRGLRRVKPTVNLISENSHTTDRTRTGESPRSINSGCGTTPGRLLRVWLKSPWDDYSLATPPSMYEESPIAYHKRRYFQKATIRTFPSPGSLRILQRLSDVQHPNIADIYDVYCHDDKLFTATEYLELSLSELDFQTFELEEWEIATIIAEVLKGSAYLLFKGLSCKELSMSSVRLSIYGDIKIVLDPEQYNQAASDEDLRFSPALLDLPCLADMIEEMMLTRYHLEDDDEAWSREAHQFLSCSLSGSMESLVNHPFLTQAMPATKLAPRIRFAIEVMRSGAAETRREAPEGGSC